MKDNCLHRYKASYIGTDLNTDTWMEYIIEYACARCGHIDMTPNVRVQEVCQHMKDKMYFGKNK